MKKIALFLLTPITLLSCNAKEKQLAGKWQAVYLDNPALTDMLVNQQHFIDTFGQNTTPEQNDSMYGVRNIDSMRQVLQMQIDSFRMMQEQTLQQTKFEFRSDKTALLYFGETPDSAHWYFDDDGALVLDEAPLKGSGTKTRMEVETLTRDTLRLRFTENGITSSATFKSIGR
jgi:hypothetical protein